MTTQVDDHTLNACLARVIGVEVRDRLQDFILPKWVSVKTGEYWNPLQSASQMEEVEAWLRENKWEYISGWNSQFNRHWAELRKGVKAFWTNDPDKKRALALAVQAMEQSQKEK